MRRISTCTFCVKYSLFVGGVYTWDVTCKYYSLVISFALKRGETSQLSCHYTDIGGKKKRNNHDGDGDDSS